MKVHFHTFGCKVNQYETAAMERFFEEAGFTVVQSDEEADVAVINSCSVTASGDQKSLRRLRQCRRAGLITVLCGCYPQAFPDRAGEIFEADIVAGNADRAALPRLVRDFAASHERVVDIPPHLKGELFEPLGAGQPDGRTRAFLKVEDGCERYCSYCIIPYARGRIRSLPPQEIRRQAGQIAAAGYRELVLTGINLSCYGRDLGLDVADALDACSVDGMVRVRFGSLEPDLLSDAIIARLAANPKLCRHFHLALQSGSEQTLRAMRRRYTAAQYRAVAEKLRAAFPDCTLTTDVIVGFPGETEEAFLESADFVRSMGFLKVHIFPYSRRPGTPAADMKEQLSRAEKEARAAHLNAVCAESRQAILRAAVGRTVRVIAEAPDSDGLLTGVTDQYHPALLPGSGIAVGDIVTGTATGLAGDRLIVEAGGQ